MTIRRVLWLLLLLLAAGPACAQDFRAQDFRAQDFGAQDFQPFFDDQTRTGIDPTPPAPRLGPLDRAVLAVCGDWGAHPRRQDFRAMLERPELAAEIATLRLAAGASAPGFADRLTAAWFDAGGFAHVFCGEPGARSLGGLHYQGRYLEMQERGWGGIATDCRRAEIVPPVYTIGVAYRAPGGHVARDCRKGYALGLDAGALLAAGFRALGRGNRDRMCLTTLPQGYSAVAVIRRGAIRTFYPDATPHCDGGATACPCGE